MHKHFASRGSLRVVSDSFGDLDVIMIQEIEAHKRDADIANSMCQCRIPQGNLLGNIKESRQSLRCEKMVAASRSGSRHCHAYTGDCKDDSRSAPSKLVLKMKCYKPGMHHGYVQEPHGSTEEDNHGILPR